MMRPRGRPPTPRAMSSDTDPVEMACTSFTSEASLPRRMIEPLPKAFSMDETASSIAFSFSGPTGISVFSLRGGRRPVLSVVELVTAPSDNTVTTERKRRCQSNEGHERSAAWGPERRDWPESSRPKGWANRNDTLCVTVPMKRGARRVPACGMMRERQVTPGDSFEERTLMKRIAIVIVTAALAACGGSSSPTSKTFTYGTATPATASQSSAVSSQVANVISARNTASADSAQSVANIESLTSTLFNGSAVGFLTAQSGVSSQALSVARRGVVSNGFDNPSCVTQPTATSVTFTNCKLTFTNTSG